jgi:hypothetical protein
MTTLPNPHTVFPLNGYNRLCFLKNIIKNQGISKILCVCKLNFHCGFCKQN